jgi:hypothetical protein
VLAFDDGKIVAELDVLKRDPRNEGTPIEKFWKLSGGNPSRVGLVTTMPSVFVPVTNPNELSLTVEEPPGTVSDVKCMTCTRSSFRTVGVIVFVSPTLNIVEVLSLATGNPGRLLPPNGDSRLEPSS